MTDDLVKIRAWLRALPDVAARTDARLVDLHSLAFDRHVGERLRGSRQPSRTDPTDIGQREAKALYDRAVKAVHHALVNLEAVSHAVGAYLNGGDPADNTLRGTMLGDEETSASEELNRLVRAQDNRRSRGEYVPNREMAQPKVPRR